MRFHMGVSFSWKQIKRIILPILIGIALYFGFNMNVYAEDKVIEYTNFNTAIYINYRERGSSSYSCPSGYSSDDNITTVSFTKDYNSTTYYNLKPYFVSTSVDYAKNSISGIKLYFPTNMNFEKDKYYHFYIKFSENSDIITYNPNLIETISSCYPEIDGKITYDEANCPFNYFTFDTNLFEFAGFHVEHNVANTIDGSNTFNLQVYRISLKAISNSSGGSLLFGSDVKQNFNTNCDVPNYIYSINAFYNRNTSSTILSNNSVTYYPIEIIENEGENINTGVGDNPTLDDVLTDSNVDLDNASGFFGDFKENDFGLSDIVKAPLILIQELSNGSSCQTLNFNVLGADVSMPSGCILWDKVPDEIETIYYIFIGGFLAYILGTKLFHDVNDLKDPNKNEVSTLDL